MDAIDPANYNKLCAVKPLGLDTFGSVLEKQENSILHIGLVPSVRGGLAEFRNLRYFKKIYAN